MHAVTGDSNGNFTRQGSLRRVLPSIDKENLFSGCASNDNDVPNKIPNIYRQEYTILAEYEMLRSENIQGVYVIPSKDSPFVWFGVVFVRSGHYENGIFRFNIILDENFPDSEHPKVVFVSDIYHPVIHPDTNELNLLDGFRVWNKSEQHIWQVLKYIWWIFAYFDASLAHVVNKEAYDLYKNDPDVYKAKINDLVKRSQEAIYDDEPDIDDQHYIRFERYNAAAHEKIRESMRAEDDKPVVKSGHSWVLPGSCQPLGRPPSPESDNES